MSNEEKKSEVFAIAHALRFDVDKLYQKSRHIVMWQFFILFMPAVLSFIVFFVINKYFEVTAEIAQTVSFIIFYLAFLYYFFKITRSYYNLKILYNDVMRRCGELSDMVDWETMRRRQVYKTLDPRIQFSIDSFYEYSRSKLCPFYGGKKRYNYLRILSLLEFIFVVTLYCLYAFGVIV